MFIGVDAGLDGAAVAIDDRGKIIFQHVMPTLGKEKRQLSLVGLHAIFRSFAECLIPIDSCCLEFVASRPGMGAPSVFKFGRTYGATEALLIANSIPYTLVTPKVWTREMHQGIEGDEPKAKSKIAISRLFPEVNLLATERSRVAHDGLIDALLIAEYARRKFKK